MKLSEYIKADAGRGRQSALCKLIGAHAPDMSRWISGERPIPEEKCILIELHTAGESTCEENRPDVAWSRIPDAQWPEANGRPVIDPARPRGQLTESDLDLRIAQKAADEPPVGWPLTEADLDRHNAEQQSGAQFAAQGG